jgi:ABC-type multidrug transport system fused ATPase/permease subunit
MFRSLMPHGLNLRLFADPKGSAALIRRLLTELGRTHWRRYFLSFAFMAVGAACTALPAYLFGRGIDQAYVYRSFYGVAIVAVAMIVIFALKGIASYGQAVNMARIANHIVAESQKRMFDKLLQQNIAFYANRHSSEFAARIAFGAGAAAQVLNLLINALGRDLLSLIGLVAVMFNQAPFMSLIGIVVMPPAIFGVRSLIKRVRYIALTEFAGSADILETMQETIQGFRIIKAFNLEGVMQSRVNESTERVEAASNKLAQVSNRATPLMEALGGIAIGVVFLYAGYRVLVLNAAPGEFVSFITAFLLAYEPAKRIARLNIDLHNNLVAVEILFDILDLPDSPPDRKKPLRVEHGAIEFANVSFSYLAGQPVLRDVSFIAQPGKVTAFVGPSGGGKTTIFNLVLALY